MNEGTVSNIPGDEGLVTADAQFFEKAYLSAVKKRQASLFEENYPQISALLDETGVQESCSVRNVMRARKVAEALIDDKGELSLNRLSQYIRELQDHLYVLGPGGRYDAQRNEHMLQVLKLLENRQDLARMLRQITRPVSNRLAEEIVRDTLCLSRNTVITDVHVRRACLAAWLTYLRQSLGSCFATAPAIIIQQEQPLQFLRDLDEMMNTGRLKRTFGGEEYAVPMSITWGNGDLKKPVILQGDLLQNETKIWRSYGIIAALEAAGLIDKDITLERKVEASKALFEACFSSLSKERRFFITNAEELIQTVLLHHYGIQQKDIDDYLNRPREIVIGLMVHVPKTSARTKGKQDPCAAYLADIEVAKTAFKSLADNALLKSWEFTLASFSEIKLDFARYNLYTSLGVNFDDAGGIGECLYRFSALRVDQANAALQALQDEYESAVIQMRYLEGRVKSASTEKEIEWIKVEYQSKQTELYHIDQQRQIAHEKASKIARLHEFLIDEYDKKFRNYFQEVYDADIHDIAAGPFDDSPAGFRLLYKHGRSNPSQWTYIRSISDFVEALVSFFTITEQEIASQPMIRGIEQEFSTLITQLVNHVRSDAFLESSLYRMARAHGGKIPKKPLEHLDQVEKKPWVYTSGGSMSILVSAYFRNEERPAELSRWVESETELFAWLIDILRQMPAPLASQYEQNPNKSMLIHSPTHAFSLKPGFRSFREALESDMYSYSWIKKNVTEPVERAVRFIEVDREMVEQVLDRLMKSVPQDFLPRFKQIANTLPAGLPLAEFRQSVSLAFLRDRGLQMEFGEVLSQDTIDATIYSMFPFTSWEQAFDEVLQMGEEIFKEEPSLQLAWKEIVRASWKRPSGRNWLPADELLSILQGVVILTRGKTESRRDLFLCLLGQMRKRGLLLPAPVVIADTNWVKDYFAFVVNPATLKLEFWSVDRYGLSGRPISHWKMWLNGSRKEPVWGVFTKPYEYVSRQTNKM